ncbi:MAG: APC family permease [Actinomycetota bacterium]
MSMTEDRPAVPADPEPASTGERKRVLGKWDITLFTVSAMLVIDQLTASASIGTSVIGWWVIAFVLFLVPSAFITAELATAYPDQGGIYVWIKRAFGSRWAARTTYWYWVNVALWMPSVFLLFAGTFAELFAEDLGKWPRAAIALGLTWAVVGVGIIRLELGKWVNNVGAVFKVAIIGALAVGGFFLLARDGAANDLAASDMFVPDWDAAKLFLPVLVYQLLGFELISSMAGETKDPKRDIPKAFAWSAVIVGGLYFLGTVGILMALPMEELGLVAGLVDTFEAIFGTSGLGQAAVYALGIAALYTFFTNMTTWSMGANRAAVEAAEGGELPKVFAHEHPRYRTPTFAFVLMGVVSSVVLLGTTAILEEEDNLYWAIFAASSVIFLLPYILMFPAFLLLRRTDAATDRPYVAPGGHGGAVLWTVLTTVGIVGSLVLFLWTPGEPVDWDYTSWLLTIVVVTLAVGEWVVAKAMGKPRRVARSTTSMARHAAREKTA